MYLKNVKRTKRNRFNLTDPNAWFKLSLLLWILWVTQTRAYKDFNGGQLLYENLGGIVLSLQSVIYFILQFCFLF